MAKWIADSDIAYHGYNNVDATADHRLSSFPNAQRDHVLDGQAMFALVVEHDRLTGHRRAGIGAIDRPQVGT